MSEIAISQQLGDDYLNPLLSSRIARSTFSLPKVCPYRSSHENKPQTQEFASAVCADDAG
jgi:hypothetical protein